MTVIFMMPLFLLLQNNEDKKIKKEKECFQEPNINIKTNLKHHTVFNTDFMVSEKEVSWIEQQKRLKEILIWE